MSERRFEGNVAAAAVFGGCLVAGMVLGGWVLGSEIKAMKFADRYVTVKGLVERTVKADSAIWPVSFKEVGNDLPTVFAKSETDKAAVLKFFAEQGISAAEITVGQIEVTDKKTNEYGNNNEAGLRYIVQQTVTVHSTDVDKLTRAAEKTAQLVQAGIAVGGRNGQGGISYKFTGLNALKPDMITEATRNARSAADRFAADSGSQVGAIRSANQGVFSISAADVGSTVGGDEEGGGNESQADSSVMKRVRVVSTVDYYLVR